MRITVFLRRRHIEVKAFGRFFIFRAVPVNRYCGGLANYADLAPLFGLIKSLSVRQKRGNIGRDIAAVGIDRNDKRAVLADDIYLIGTVIKNYCERIRTSQTVKC